MHRITVVKNTHGKRSHIGREEGVLYHRVGAERNQSECFFSEHLCARISRMYIRFDVLNVIPPPSHSLETDFSLQVMSSGQLLLI